MRQGSAPPPRTQAPPKRSSSSSPGRLRRRSSRRRGWRSRKKDLLGLLSVSPAVIPAPLASEACERDQAGTQTTRRLLIGAGVRTAAAQLRPIATHAALPSTSSTALLICRVSAAEREFAERCRGPGLVPLAP